MYDITNIMIQGSLCAVTAKTIDIDPLRGFAYGISSTVFTIILEDLCNIDNLSAFAISSIACGVFSKVIDPFHPKSLTNVIKLELRKSAVLYEYANYLPAIATYFNQTEEAANPAQ